MKQLYTIAIFLFCTLAATSQTDNNALKFISFSEKQSITSSNEGLGSQDMTAKNYWHSYHKDLFDTDGDSINAVMVIFIENMPDAELVNVNITTPNAKLEPASIDLKEINGKKCRAVRVPGSEIGEKYDFINVTYNNVTSRISNPVFKTKGLYTAIFSNPQRTNATINIIPSINDVSGINFDGKELKVEDPMVIKEISYGEHKLKIYSKNPDCELYTDTIINIEPTNNAFTFDIRKNRSIKIIDADKAAIIQLIEPNTNKVIATGQGTVAVDRLKIGAYQIFVPTKNYTETFILDAKTPFELRIKSSESRPIRISSLQNNHPLPGAQIIVDYNTIDQTTPATIDLTYGTHDIAVNYSGLYAQQRITVGKKSPSEYQFKLNYRKTKRSWNPFDYDYEQRPVAISFGYCQKYFIISEKPKDGYVGATNKMKYSSCMNEDKVQHGFQMGMAYEPYFGYGQGLSVGLYWQMFFTEDEYEDPNSVIEHDLYIPLEYRFRLPLSEQSSVFAGAGIAAQIGLENKLHWDEEGYEPVNLGFGDTENDYGLAYPKKYQFYVPLSVGLQWKALELNFKYSWGLTDNAKLYGWSDSEYYDYTMKARMMEFNLNIVF